MGCFQTVVVAAATALLVLATSPLAHADELAPPPPPQRKSALVSTGLALGGVAGCIAGTVAKHKLFNAGAVISGRIVEVVQVTTCVLGPSAGQWYTDSPWRIRIASGLRAAGFIVGAVGFSLDDQNAREAVVVTASGVIAYTMIYDLIAAPFAANRYNKRFDRVTITPAPMTTPSGPPGAGLFLSGAF
ncbi:MAG TPA: hypothetical protein VM261_39020 [Kofleriaceae bacterium]|nr:hypothetical protein [Kofleriaceae bacterium]